MSRGPSPGVAICLATHEPDPQLFAVQVESIRAQVGVEWHCFVSDDASSPGALAAIGEILGSDGRFTFSRSGQRLGFYRNFERAIGMVPAGFGLIALSDQDDRWYPDKLASLAAGLGEANLVYSDQRLVEEDGTVIADSYWTARRNNHTDFISLLFANTVTGAASMFRREVAELALPFPEVPGEQYHDHWLALVAMATGELAYVDRPLYDYVQHGGAALGHERANAGQSSLGWRRLDPRRWREIAGGWGSAWFDVFLRLQGLAQVLLERGGAQLLPARRRALERFLAAGYSPTGLPWLWLRSFRHRFGRDETMGAERVLARAVLYRHLTAIWRRLPAALRQRVGPDPERPDPETGLSTEMRRKVAPLFPLVGSGTPTVNVLIPTVDLDHFFGGYIAKFNLALRLARHGIPTRLLTVDPTPPLPEGWQRQVESYAGLSGFFDEVEIVFGRDGREPPRIGSTDRFVATTWWTAHIADRLSRQLGHRRFLYLIQEYEPLTVPPGKWAELARESYGFSHNALFSTAILQEHFVAEGIGVFADGGAAGAEHSASFENAITPVPPPQAEVLAAREPRRLLFYGRPEAHAQRNLYETGVEALRAAVAAGHFGDGWTLTAIGSTGKAGSLDLGSGRHLELLPRTGHAEYGELLAGFDLGLALMDAPHPSLVPIEMASAGMRVVTTTWGAKTAESMAGISDNLVAVEPDPAVLARALAEAEAGSGEFAARVAGAAVNWSRSWDEALPPALLDRIANLLDLE